MSKRLLLILQIFPKQC